MKKNTYPKLSISRLFFSIIFSLALFFMSKISFFGMVKKNNYMDIVLLSDFKWLILLVPIIYLLALLIEKYYKKIYSYVIIKEDFKNKKLFCIAVFVILLLIYMVYYLTFFPGGVFIDTWTSFRMLTGKIEFTNQQPVFYTLILSLVKLFPNNYEIGFAILTFLQVIFMISCITYFIYWLLDKHVNPIIVTFIALFFGTFNLYPLYSVSVWKDTLFSLAVFVYAITLINIMIDIKNRNIKICNIIAFNIFSLFTMLLRNNGIYVTFATFLILLISLVIFYFYKKQKVAHMKTFLIVSFLTIVLFELIQLAYSLFGINMKGQIEEKIAIPIQQVARVVVTDGNITDKQMELIEKVLSKEEIKYNYCALIVDPIKFNSQFNAKYIEENKFEYLKLWIELFFQNPNEYIRGYLLQTSGFWTFNVRGKEAYASPTLWETLSEELGTTDLIAKYSHESFKNDLIPTSYFSGGFFFWIIFSTMFITYRIANKKYLLAYLPPMLLWATIMVSVPMGSALRYVYALVLAFPLYLVYPLIAKNLSEKSK